MTTPRPLHRLYAVVDGSALPLSIPDVPPSHVHDSLPLGVYEALRTFDHDRFVGLPEHLDRLERSIELAGLEGGFDREGFLRALDQVARGFPAAESKIRFDQLAEPAQALGSSSRTLIHAAELILPPPEVYENGVAAGLCDLRRRQPEVKEAAWVLQRRAAEEDGSASFESILVDGEGRLLEGIMSNLFWVRGGVLHTAPVAGVLPGITRGFVMELARDRGFEVREEHARVDELGTLEEAFFTTSVRGIIPITSIAGETLGAGRVGALTRELMGAYAEFCSRRAAPAVAP